MTELTRAEIETMAADIHASHPLHKALTQLLCQLDAAKQEAVYENLQHGLRVTELRAANNGRDFLLDQVRAANARADAVAGQMRERCKAVADKHRALVPNHHPDYSNDDKVAQGYGNAALNISSAIDALTLHEEPNNGNV